MEKYETQYRNQPWKVTCTKSWKHIILEAKVDKIHLLINTINAPNEVIRPSSICWDRESTAFVSSFLVWSTPVESEFCPKATARIVSVVKDPYTLHGVNEAIQLHNIYLCIKLYLVTSKLAPVTTFASNMANRTSTLFFTNGIIYRSNTSLEYRRDWNLRSILSLISILYLPLMSTAWLWDDRSIDILTVFTFEMENVGERIRLFVFQISPFIRKSPLKISGSIISGPSYQVR